MLCIGHSHMACVLAAAQETDISVVPVVLKESKHFEGMGSSLQVVPPERFAQWLSQSPREGPTFSFIGGRRHVHPELRKNPRPYDVFLPAAPNLPIEEGTEIIPINAVQKALAKRITPDLEMLDTLFSHASGPVFHFESPPPPSIGWWESIATERGTNREFHPAPFLRYKLWRLNSENVREVVEAKGGTFVEAPAAARDDDDLLRAELVGNSTHANSAYGALVLEQMRAVA